MKRLTWWMAGEGFVGSCVACMYTSGGQTGDRMWK